MGDGRSLAASTYTLNGTRRPPDAILDDWKNYLRKVFNKSRRPPRYFETVDEYPESSLLPPYVTNRPGGSIIPTQRIAASMFGRRLKDSVDETTGVAKFVLWCVKEIEKTGDGLDTDAIYRTSGNQSKLQMIAKQGETGMREMLENEDNVNVLTAALKLFFRQLVDPIIDYEDFNRALQTESPNEEILLLVQGLPAAERNTLAFIMSHLQDVLDHHAVNTMDIPSLASVFGPTLMRLSTNPQDMISDMKQQNRIVEFLLSEYDTIFPRDGRRDATTILDVHQQLHSGSSDSDAGAKEKAIVDKHILGTITYNNESSDEDENNGKRKPVATVYSQRVPVRDHTDYQKQNDTSVIMIQTTANEEPRKVNAHNSSDISYYEDVESVAIAKDKKQKNYFSSGLSNFMENTKMKIAKSQPKPVQTGDKHIDHSDGLDIKQPQQYIDAGASNSRRESTHALGNQKDEYAIIQKKSERNSYKDTVDHYRPAPSPPPKLPSTGPPIYRKNPMYTLDTYNNRQEEFRKSTEQLHGVIDNMHHNVVILDEQDESTSKDEIVVQTVDSSFATIPVPGRVVNKSEVSQTTKYPTGVGHYSKGQTVIESNHITSRRLSDSDSDSSTIGQDSASESDSETRYNSLRSVPTAL